MNKIQITIEITDQETVEAYADIPDDIIFSDLVDGDLRKVISLVQVTRITTKNKNERQTV